MERFVVLLRGVNVGGNNKLKMAEFRDALSEQGFADVQTYIQSGNAVLGTERTADEVATLVSEVLKTRFEIDVPVLVIAGSELAAAVNANPFEGDLSRIMLWFCFEPLADFNPATLDALRAPDEEAFFAERVIYLYAESGISRSKFAAKIDRLTPVQVTARNLRTAQKLLEMVAVA